MNWLFYIALITGGYVASIYTWPWIRQKALGVQAEADGLRNRARDLEAAVRAKV